MMDQWPESQNRVIFKISFWQFSKLLAVGRTCFLHVQLIHCSSLNFQVKLFLYFISLTKINFGKVRSELLVIIVLHDFYKCNFGL